MAKRIAVIVPAFNCALRIGAVLADLDLSTLDVVVVDDGSTDGTGDIARRLGVEVISHGRNLGVGAAIKTGTAAGADRGCSHVITIDGDGQHEPALVSRMVEVLASEDRVIGQRFGDASVAPDAKAAVNLLGSLLLEAVTGEIVRDPSCGLRGFPVEDVDRSWDDGYPFVHEHLVSTLASSLPWARIDIPTTYWVTEPWVTRREELRGFIRSLDAYGLGPASDVCASLMQALDRGDGFVCELQGFQFQAHRLADLDAYLVQTIGARRGLAAR